MEKEQIPFADPGLAIHIVSREMAPGRSYRQLHQHGAIELVYVESGTLLCQVGEDRLTLTPDTLVLINRYAVHQLIPPEVCYVTYLQIDLDQYRTDETPAELLGEFISLVNTSPYRQFEKSSQVYRLLHAMKDELTEKRPGADAYLRGYVLQLIGFMQREGMLENGDRHLRDILPVACYIAEHYREPLYLEEIARQVGLDKFRLCRLFKSVTGGTVVEYIQFVRLRHAQQLLLAGGRNTTETALECGFSSIQYFNKVFKKHLGCTPSAFRKQQGW